MTTRSPASPTSNFPGTLVEIHSFTGSEDYAVGRIPAPDVNWCFQLCCLGFRDENCRILRYVDLLNLGKCPLNRRSPQDLAPFLLPRHRSARHRN